MTVINVIERRMLLMQWLHLK